MGEAASDYWGQQSISTHVNIPKRKFERKMMHVSEQGFPNSRGAGGDGAVNSTSVEGWREIGNFAGEINLYSGGNLRRSDSDHSNLFQGQKQNAVNIEH